MAEELRLSAEKGDCVAGRQCIWNGADVDQLDRDGKSPLIHAARFFSLLFSSSVVPVGAKAMSLNSWLLIQEWELGVRQAPPRSRGENRHLQVSTSLKLQLLTDGDSSSSVFRIGNPSSSSLSDPSLLSQLGRLDAPSLRLLEESLRSCKGKEE